MNLPSSAVDMETIILEDGALRIDVFGQGAVGVAVLKNIRTHYGRNSDDDMRHDNSRTGPMNELSILLINLDPSSANDTTWLAGSMVNKTNGWSMTLRLIDNMNNASCDQLLLSTEPISDERIAVHPAEAEASGNIIFDRIRSIANSLASPDAINIGFVKFCRNMTGGRKELTSVIKTGWGSAQGTDRAEQAVAQVLANASFRRHLSLADSIMVHITAPRNNFMGREMKKIYRDIRQYVPEHIGCMCSICYEQNIQDNQVKVEVWASRLAN